MSSWNHQILRDCTTHVIACCGDCRGSQAHHDRCQDNSKNGPQQPPFRLRDGLPAKNTAAHSGGQAQLIVPAAVRCMCRGQQVALQPAACRQAVPRDRERECPTAEACKGCAQ